MTCVCYIYADHSINCWYVSIDSDVSMVNLSSLKLQTMILSLCARGGLCRLSRLSTYTRCFQIELFQSRYPMDSLSSDYLCCMVDKIEFKDAQLDSLTFAGLKAEGLLFMTCSIVHSRG